MPDLDTQIIDTAETMAVNFDCADMARQAGINKLKSRNKLNQLAKKGLIKRVSTGVYSRLGDE